MNSIAFLLLLGIAVPALAETTADCPRSAPRGQTWKSCKNTVRRNETVSQYLLTRDGNLYAKLKRGGPLCQITNDVDDFKVSQHPKDAAMIYYKRQDDLFVLNRANVRGDGDCPKTTKNLIMRKVAEYKVATNTDTTIVNAALDQYGKLVAWDNIRPVYIDSGVTDFQMNSCFGADRKSFSSYVMFTMDYAGYVTKVKGEYSGGFFQYISDKTTKGRYASISSFKDRENVCK